MIEKREKTVRLKGTRDGFILMIGKDFSFETLENEVEELFVNLKQFAKGALVKVQADEKDFDTTLVERISIYLKDTFQVGEVIKYRPAEPLANINGKDVKFMSGRVRSGQHVFSENHLVILGDVNPGGEIVAGGDIIILGSLCGTAIAGQADRKDSIIIALDFRPVQVQIAGIVAAGVSEARGTKTEYAFIEDGAIVVLDYKKANPFARLPILVER